MAALSTQIAELLQSYSGSGVTTEVIQHNDAALQNAADGTPGFSLALLDIIENTTYSRGVRQRAVATLQQFVVKRHWPEPPSAALAEAERMEVRRRVPLFLSESDGRIRAGMADTLAVIASEDWPVQWPQVVDALVQCCAGPLTAEGAEDDQLRAWLCADGALLAMLGFVKTVSTSLAAQLADELFPVLIRVIASDATPAAEALASSAFGLDVRCKALDVVREVLGTLEGATHDKQLKTAAREVLDKYFMSLLGVLAQILKIPGWGSRVCAVKVAALRSINYLIYAFPLLFKPVIDHVMSELFTLLSHALVAFRGMELDDVDAPSSAAGTSTDGVTPGILDAYASGDVESMPSLILAQLLVIMQTVLVSPKKFINKSIRNFAAHLGGVVLSVCQLTESILAEWGDDSAAFLRDEVEETNAGTNLRQEATQVIRDVVDMYGMHGLNSFLETCMAALSGSAATSEFCVLSGQKWKVFEAAIYVVGSCRVYLVNPKRIPSFKNTAGVPLNFDISAFVNHLIVLLNGNGAAAFDDSPYEIQLVCAPYVVGRSLWCASCLAHAPSVTEDACEQLLTASVEGLQPDFTMPIRIMACKSLTRLIKRLRGPRLDKTAPLIFERLTALITNAIKVEDHLLEVDESAVEFIHLLVQTAAYSGAAAAAAQGTITNLLLHLWCRKGTHMLLAPALATGLECMVSLDDNAAASAAIEAELPILTAFLHVAAVVTHNPNGPFPNILLPDGSELPVSALDTTVKGVPELGAMTEAAITTLTAILRKMREVVMTVGSETPYMQLPGAMTTACSHVLDLVQHSTDHKVVGQGLDFLTALVRLCGNTLNADAVNATLLAAARVLQADEDVPDDAAGGVCPLITALISHLRMPDFIDMVIPAMLTRLAKATLPSFVIRLCHALAHSIITDFDKTSTLLRDTPVELPSSGFLSLHACPGAESTTQSGLVVYLRSVAKFMEVISAPISKQIIIHATSRLLTRSELLEHCAPYNVYISHSSDSLDGPSKRTRSKAKSEVISVSLAVRVLSLIIKEWATAVFDDEEEDDGDLADSESGSDDDDDEEDDEDNEHNKEDIAVTTRKLRPSPFAPADNVADLLDGEAAYKPRRRKARAGSDDDADMALLHDLLSGGDAGGTGKTLLDLLASGHHLGDDDDEDEDEEDVGLGLQDAADSEDIAEIAVWDEPPSPGGEGSLFAPLPHDPVVAHFVGVDAEGHVTTQPAVEDLTGFLVVLARASIRMPSSPAAVLVGATTPLLDELEHHLLQERILPLAAATH